MNQIAKQYVLPVCAALVLSCVSLRAEDAAPDKPKGADAPKGGERGRGGRGGPGGNWGGGGAGGGLDQLLNNFAGRGNGGAGGITGMVSRMLGFDLDDPKAPAKVEQLPLGANKRMVTEIPVGGVDNFNPTGAGWKVESVFKLTPEQTKATDALRGEYAAEEKKLNQEILDAQKALAAKVTDLRAKYEKKANEVLTGADKEAKEKMDALAADVYAKNAATVTETLPLYDTKDWQQGMTMVRALREKTGKTTQDAEATLLTLIPEDNRAKFTEIIKAQADQRNRLNQGMQGMMGGRNRGQGGGAGGAMDGGPVKPPKAPEGDKF